MGVIQEIADFMWNAMVAPQGSNGKMRRSLDNYMDDPTPFGPKTLIDLYLMLPNDQKTAFLGMLANVSPANVPLYMVAGMSEAQKVRFYGAIMPVIANRMIPMFVSQAIDVVRECPTASRKEMSDAIELRTKDWLRGYIDLAERIKAEELKSKRDRKADPKTARRNVEICDLRKRDPKHWTQGQLAKKFKVSSQAIRKILGQETKWRRLAAEDLGDPENPPPRTN
jgi:hypothetical protein